MSYVRDVALDTMLLEIARIRRTAIIGIELRSNGNGLHADTYAALNESLGRSRAIILSAALLALDGLQAQLQSELDAELARDQSSPKA